MGLAQTPPRLPRRRCGRLGVAHLLVVVLGLTVLSGACKGEKNDAATRAQEGQTAAKRVSTESYQRVRITNETAFKGVFDPSVEYGADGRVGWMVYSALEAPPDGSATPNPQFIHTQLAKSTDRGKTWTLVERINRSFEATVQLEGRSVLGVWWHEVPSLLFDPGDAAKPWKLFWLKYFAVPKPYYEPPHPSREPTVRIIQYMWIAYKAAATPAELDEAPEIHLFDAGQSARVEDRARHNLNTFHPTLRDRKAYTEPGTLALDGSLYVSLGSFTGPKVEEHRLVLFSSKDHGATWNYAGQLLEASDATRFGYRVLGASSLARETGRIFLMVSPMDRHGHHGTYVFELANLAEAKLKRDSRGHLVVHKYLPPSVPLIQGHINAGESTYHAHNTAGGIVMPQTDEDSAPALAQIFNTGIRLVP